MRGEVAPSRAAEAGDGGLRHMRMIAFVVKPFHH
jgi:hypothetical protein